MLRRCLIPVLLLSFALAAQAQKRVAADVEVKTLTDGKVVTVTKRVFCQGNGRMVTVFHTPKEYYMITNLKGEMKLYVPSSNEVTSQVAGEYSSKGELLYLFLSGRSDDLGLVSFGYTLTGSRYDEDGYLVRTYVTKAMNSAPKVEVVLKDYLPVYLGYYNGSGKLMSKSYLSGYNRSSSFVFPERHTSISYTEKGDSTVVRTVYSNLEVDPDSKFFDYQVPSDAKAVKNPLIEAFKKIK